MFIGLRGAINMKKITLKENGTFEHVWLKKIHTIPVNAIEVSDADFVLLSQNPESKKYENGKVVDFVKPFVLSEYKEAKRAEIRAKFEKESSSNFIDSVGRAWNGGFDSVVKMDAARRLVEAVGGLNVGLFDALNIEHTLSNEAALTVIAEIGGNYQSLFRKKQLMMTAVDGAVSQAEIDAISVIF